VAETNHADKDRFVRTGQHDHVTDIDLISRDYTIHRH
jgi:hypothetical protein